MSDFKVWRGDLFRPDRTLDVDEHATRAMDVGIRRYRPDVVVRLFSGGGDSLCASHKAKAVADAHGVYSPAVHINTGIGVEATREYVRETCRLLEWELIELGPDDTTGFTYEEMVLKWGFPGPAAHQFMYIHLKERALEELQRRLRARGMERVMYVSGARKAESTRRMGNTKVFEPDRNSKKRVWVSPLAEWEAIHKHYYVRLHGLTTNPVSDLMHMSGECLCGAFARPGELDEWEGFGFTDVVGRIRELEAKAAGCGVPAVWGSRPPRCEGKSVDPYQAMLGDAAEQAPAHLCTSCSARAEEEEAA